METPVVFFDGVCGLCNRLVDFLIRADRKRALRYSPLQGTTALDHLGARARPEGDYPSMVYWENGETFEKSEAALKIAAQLGGLWKLAALARLVPKGLRDALYDGVARNRFRWFGRRDTCRLPSPDERQLFLP
jgi:predicted DCC family thiol-disulfide oxidoreductase YuxK